MKIDVRFRSLDPSVALRNHALRGVQFHLDRFGHDVSAVMVRISDVNGPKGGLDKTCQVSVRGRRIATVITEQSSADAYAAVDLAIGLVGRLVARDLDRRRTDRPTPGRGGLALRF